MQRLLSFVVMLVVLSAASTSLARMAAIQTSAPLADQSESAFKAAVVDAVRTAVRGAVAMGLPHVKLDQALVLDHAVVVRILATDGEEGSEAEPGEPDSDSEASRPEEYKL